MRELLETTCNRERVAIIFNPVSGTMDGTLRRSQLEAAAKAGGLACGLTETDIKQGAEPLAREALADGMERVIVSGGDGSMMEAAGVLAGTGVALAVIPGGTGNLLALNLGLPTDTDTAMELALTGHPRPIDVGQANGQRFLIMAGIGVDARVIHDADRETKKRLGVLAYFLAGWRNIRRPRTRFTITIDGERFERNAQSVMIANVGRITGGVELVPGADPEDGLLDVAILRTRNRRGLIAVALRSILGQGPPNDLLEFHKAREVIIETAQPQLVQVDGNEAPATDRLVVTVEPGALQLVHLDPKDRPAPLLSPIPGDTEEARRWAPIVIGGVAVVTAGYLIYRRWPRRKKKASGDLDTE